MMNVGQMFDPQCFVGSSTEVGRSRLSCGHFWRVILPVPQRCLEKAEEEKFKCASQDNAVPAKANLFSYLEADREVD